MATTSKFKTATGVITTVEIDSDFGVEINVPTDSTELKVKITGPQAMTEVDTIGGRDKRH